MAADNKRCAQVQPIEPVDCVGDPVVVRGSFVARASGAALTSSTARQGQAASRTCAVLRGPARRSVDVAVTRPAGIPTDYTEPAVAIAAASLVSQMTQGAAASIDDLKRYGVAFTREADGRVSQRFFGAHKFQRTAFAGDCTGLEIQRSLIRRAGQLNLEGKLAE